MTSGNIEIEGFDRDYVMTLVGRRVLVGPLKKEETVRVVNAGEVSSLSGDSYLLGQGVNGKLYFPLRPMTVYGDRIVVGVIPVLDELLAPYLEGT